MNAHLYEELHRRVRPIMTAYETDLEEHDRNLIENYPDVPFLHFTRPWGTHMTLLHAHDSTAFPAPGLRVPYLFGEADREHIASQMIASVEYHVKHPDQGLLNGWTVVATHYFDGVTLREVTLERALEIVTEHVRGVRAWWRVGQPASRVSRPLPMAA